MGLCDCCNKTFCLTELDTFRHKLLYNHMIEDLTEIDTRFCVACVTHINGYDLSCINCGSTTNHATCGGSE